MKTLEIKKNIVLKGESKVFQNWHEFTGVSMEDFIAGLEWLCEEPIRENGKLRRELACRRDGTLLRLTRMYDKNDFCVFVDEQTHRVWSGDGMNKISISADDRI